MSYSRHEIPIFLVSYPDPFPTFSTTALNDSGLSTVKIGWYVVAMVCLKWTRSIRPERYVKIHTATMPIKANATNPNRVHFRARGETDSPVISHPTHAEPLPDRTTKAAQNMFHAMVPHCSTLHEMHNLDRNGNGSDRASDA